MAWLSMGLDGVLGFFAAIAVGIGGVFGSGPGLTPDGSGPGLTPDGSGPGLTPDG